ncbi:hypothetical protein L484_004975 [Morus notabilis]|uniref:Uncharacterized protein n=1 Tax=Morus notabilis TaxID=981085 RepID=W9S6G2_9ROSA|nr:hypothetical protein L484_004975 [Morus notabilis]
MKPYLRCRRGLCGSTIEIRTERLQVSAIWVADGDDEIWRWEKGFCERGLHRETMGECFERFYSTFEFKGLSF